MIINNYSIERSFKVLILIDSSQLSTSWLYEFRSYNTMMKCISGRIILLSDILFNTMQGYTDGLELFGSSHEIEPSY